MIYINNKPLKFGTFANGESFADIPRQIVDELKYNEKHFKTNYISMRFENDMDLIRLKMVKDYIENLGLPVSLFMPYVPYSRMDRPINDKLFSLKTLGNLINEMNFKKVIVFETHSNTTLGVLNRTTEVHYTIKLVLNAMRAMAVSNGIDNNASDEEIFAWCKANNIWLAYPDAGAEKRYIHDIPYGKHFLCSKNRDMKTNRIISLDVHVSGNDVIIPGGTAIIADDLASYGTTFIVTAQKLKEMGFSKVFLCVTHCENNILNGDFPHTDVIDKIFTTDSILTVSEPRIIVDKIIEEGYCFE